MDDIACRPVPYGRLSYDRYRDSWPGAEPPDPDLPDLEVARRPECRVPVTIL